MAEVSWIPPDDGGFKGPVRGRTMKLLAAEEEGTDSDTVLGFIDNLVGCNLPVLAGATVFFRWASVVFEGSLN